MLLAKFSDDDSTDEFRHHDVHVVASALNVRVSEKNIHTGIFTSIIKLVLIPYGRMCSVLLRKSISTFYQFRKITTAIFMVSSILDQCDLTYNLTSHVFFLNMH